MGIFLASSSSLGVPLAPNKLFNSKYSFLSAVNLAGLMIVGMCAFFTSTHKNLRFRSETAVSSEFQWLWTYTALGVDDTSVF